MYKYYEVILPVPVNNTFYYKYKSDTDILYRRVRLQFGRWRTIGFTINRLDNIKESQYDIKNIEGIIDDKPILREELAELYKFIRREYLTYPYIALNTLLPPMLKLSKTQRKSQKPKTEEIVVLAKSILEIKRAIDSLLKKSPAQALILQLLLSYGGEFTKTELIKFSGKGYPILKALIDKKLIKYLKRSKPVNDSIIAGEKSEEVILNDEQQNAVKSVSENFNPFRFGEFLLHGITSSGKTEVYMALIDEAIKKGKEAVVLVPEIGLTTQIWERFYKRYGEKVIFYHSGISEQKKIFIWNSALESKIKIVIGPRSALYLPFKNLGIIIVDEEQSLSYKSSENPRINSRTLAVKRAQINKIPVVLGSATPSVETYYRTQTGKSRILVLTKRINNLALPQIDIVDMREEFKNSRSGGLFSKQLEESIIQTLKNEDQVMLFLNRRGFSRFLRCSYCGYTFKCPKCDISLTLHNYGKTLLCHYCGFEIDKPSVCPECGKNVLNPKGIGTEQLEIECLQKFPLFVTRRMDIDSMKDRKSYQDILLSFANREIDILVGTQMISKGLDFPGISLVGIIDADTILNLPEYLSPENTFSQVIQVAGRAGRGDTIGKVIVQTYKPEHYAIKMTELHNYEKFYENEITRRKKLRYPPYYRMIRIICSGKKEDIVLEKCREIKSYLNISNDNFIYGPMECFFKKIKDKYRYHILIKILPKNFMGVVEEIKDVIYKKVKKIRGIDVSVDVDPVSFF